MNSLRTTLARGGLVAALAIGCLAVTGTAAAATTGQEAVARHVRPGPGPSRGLRGDATCLSCHEDRGAAIKKGPHSHAFRAGTPMAPKGCQACHGDTKAELGCEACHGPGKEHADASGDKTKIRSFASLSPKDASETCVSCHFRTEHTFWAGSQHDERNVGCTTCHSVHAPEGEKQLKAASETELCVQCHRTIVNKQLRFNHMPVREGKLACSSCHNVHGAANVKLLKAGGTRRRVLRQLPRREARAGPVGARRR